MVQKDLPINFLGDPWNGDIVATPKRCQSTHYNAAGLYIDKKAPAVANFPEDDTVKTRYTYALPFIPHSDVITYPLLIYDVTAGTALTGVSGSPGVNQFRYPTATSNRPNLIELNAGQAGHTLGYDGYAIGSILNQDNETTGNWKLGTQGSAVYGQFDSNIWGVIGAPLAGMYCQSSVSIFAYLGHTSYGVYGQYTSAIFGYLGSVLYGMYAQYTAGNYGYIADGTYGVYGVSGTSWGVLGTSNQGVRGQVGSVYGYLGSTIYGVFGAYTALIYGFLGSSNVGAFGQYGANCYGMLGSGANNAGVIGACTGVGGIGGIFNGALTDISLTNSKIVLSNAVVNAAAGASDNYVIVNINNVNYKVLLHS